MSTVWTIDSAAEYHGKKEYLSSSALRKGLQSLAHLRCYLDTPQENSEAFAFGRLAHTATLEPEKLSLYSVMPKIDRRTKEGKAALLVMEQSGKEFVPEDDYKTALSCAAAVHSHPVASELLKGATVESSLYWEQAGVKCKARPDAFQPDDGILIDLKTAQNAGDRFSREIFSYGYHIQLCFYRLGLMAAGFEVNRAVIIAAEKSPPFAVAVYKLDTSSLELAEREIMSFLPKYKEALESGKWPAYPQQIVTVYPPKWMMEV